MKYWPYWNFKGLYYLQCRFSLNEGAFPNIHIDWGAKYLYIAIAPYIGFHVIDNRFTWHTHKW